VVGAWTRAWRGVEVGVFVLFSFGGGLHTMALVLARFHGCNVPRMF